MKILYLTTGGNDSTFEKIVEESGKDHEVTVVDLAQNKNYDEIVTLLEESDKVISW